MPSPHSTFTEMVTTTLRNHPTEVADNVSTHNALYRYLKDRKQINVLDGGYEIVRPLDWQMNGTYQRYSGYDTLNVNSSNVLTAAKYDWVQAAVHVTASGDELRKNSGKEQLINLMKARVKNAMRTAANMMSIDLFSSGALTNQMGGLGALITSDGTGTVGGINSGTYTFWANQYREISGNNTWSKSTIKGEMNAIWLTVVRGNDMPNLILSTNDFYAAYWEGLQDLARYNDPTSSKSTTHILGPALKYANAADVVFDSNSNFTATGEKMYFLNLDYLELCVMQGANWQQLDDKVPTNQDAVLIPIIAQMQLTTSNRARQGLLLDASA
jgi:hypothetical protein